MYSRRKMSGNLKKEVMVYNYYSLLYLIKTWTIPFYVIVLHKKNWQMVHGVQKGLVE